MLTEMYVEGVARFNKSNGMRIGGKAIIPEDSYTAIKNLQSPRLEQRKQEFNSLDPKLTDKNKENILSYRRYRQTKEEMCETGGAYKKKRKKRTPIVPVTMQQKLKLNKEDKISPLI